MGQCVGVAGVASCDRHWLVAPLHLIISAQAHHVHCFSLCGQTVELVESSVVAVDAVGHSGSWILC
ncbi:hypothetical protein BpHYR1_024578 [Brachionus plicatilis]|uniref:Uncharacterized protein n=1 Tax=Brachionus plicatilis TaxID=10195 RepID=A0A3M7R032_BRAPC|nr:hypothetical protein BpHYR1_024578 [Brachionus plicatilis]